MFKALMYALLFGLVKLAFWLQKKKWWIAGVFAVWLLWHYHFFSVLFPFILSWFKHWSVSSDVKAISGASFFGGLLLGGLITGIIVQIKKENKEYRKRMNAGDWVN